MVDRVSELLFKPSQLRKYKDTKMRWVWLHILVLGLLTVLVPLVDFARFPGFVPSQRYSLQRALNVDFATMAEGLPNCQLTDGTLSCEEPNEVYELGVIQNRYKLVVDPKNQVKETSDFSYNTTVVAYTEEGLYYHTSITSIRIPYDRLPAEWQTFDFVEMKAQPLPEVALYDYFVGGLNAIYKDYLPFILVVVLAYGVLSMVVKTLFISLLFLLFFKRLGHTYRQIFKVAVFSQTLVVVLGLLSNLLGFMIIPTFFLTFLTFIYLYRALAGPMQIKREE